MQGATAAGAQTAAILTLVGNAREPVGNLSWCSGERESWEKETVPIAGTYLIIEASAVRPPRARRDRGRGEARGGERPHRRLRRPGGEAGEKPGAGPLHSWVGGDFKKEDAWLAGSKRPREGAGEGGGKHSGSGPFGPCAPRPSALAVCPPLWVARPHKPRATLQACGGW